MEEAGAFRISADHPSLPGHFPGQPIVPGVVVLDEAIALILQHLPDVRLAGFGAVKFLTPVLPEHVVEVAYERNEASRVNFVGSVAGVPVVRGSARVVPK